MKNRLKKLIFVFLFIVISMFISVTVNNKIKSVFSKSNTKLSQNNFENTSGKEVTGLGISPIINPEYANGNWNKVWYGSGSAPLRFNVLNTHETNMSQGKVGMLLDCDSIVRGADKAMNNFWLYEWNNSDLARSVKWILDDRFDEPERAAGLLLPPNKPNKADTDGPDIHSSGNKKYNYTDPKNKWSNAFILDAYEVLNPTYGFPTTEGPSALRKKTGGTEYWLRSENGNLSQSDYLAYVSDSTGMGLKSDGWNQYSVSGVSPAINLNVSKVLFSTLVSGEAGTHNAEYKLTVIDDYTDCNGAYGCRDLYSFKIGIPSGKQVTRSDRTITVPFAIQGGINKDSISQISILVTDKPWNSEGAQILSYGKLENIEGNIHTSGTGTYTIPDGINLYDENAGGAYVYLFAESIREGNKPDHASNIVKLNFTKTIRVDAEGFDNYYDGQEHGITVTPYTEGTVIKYGLSEGTYNLDESPKYKNAGTNVRVYYEATLDGRETLHGSKVIKISKRPIKVSGIIANQKEYDGNTNATLDISEVTYDGLIQDDDIRITNYEGTFANKNQNPFQKVNLTYELTGDDISNYVLDTANSQKTTTANIYLRHIKVSGIKVYYKIWDGTTNAKLDYSEVEIDRMVSGDDVYITATGTFENAAEGIDKPVTISNITLHGVDGGNYYLEPGQQQTIAYGTISARGSLPIVHIPDENDLTFEYDGSPHEVVITAESTVENPDPSKISILYGDVESMTNPSWSKYPRSLTEVGTRKVYFDVIDQNQGYTEVKGSFIIRVTPAPLAVNDNSIKITSKVYDGTTSATPDLETATFDNLKGNDIDYLYLKTGTAVFSDKNAGENKSVTLSGLTLGDNNQTTTKRRNYNLKNDALTKGTIKKRPLTISGITAADKIYDGNTNVTVNTSHMKINNKIDGDDINVTVTGSFINGNAGEDKTVNLNYSLNGPDASNYYIDLDTSQQTTTATIDKKDFTLEINNVDVEYDGEEHGASVNVIDSIPVTIKYGTSADDCTLNESPKYKKVSSNKVYYTITSTNENYNSINGTLSINIKKRGIIVNGIKAENKKFDGNTNATLNTDEMVIDNVLDNEEVNISVNGSFEDENVGENKPVNLNYTLSGTDANNYRIDMSRSQMGTTANIIEVSPENLSIIKGDNQSFTLGDNKDIEIICNGALNDLTAIKVNDVVLDESNYTLKNGSTVLTLKNSYLNTLSKGQYKITFEYGDKSVDANLNVVDPNAQKNPLTNDNIMVYISMLVLSILGLISIRIYTKRKKIQ